MNTINFQIPRSERRKAQRERLREHNKIDAPKSKFPHTVTQIISRYRILALLAVIAGEVAHDGKSISIRSNAIEAQRPSTSPFSLGRWNFQPDHTLPHNVTEDIKNLFSSAYPLLEKLIGQASTSAAGEWQLLRVNAVHNYESSIDRTLGISPDSSDALRVHEFVHMFQGVDFPEVNFVREGYAVAVSNLVGRDLKIERWDSNVVMAPILGTNMQAHIGMAPNVNYDHTPNPYMLLTRYHVSAAFWERLESFRPGTLKAVTKNIRTIYENRNFNDVSRELSTLQPRDLLTFIGVDVPDSFYDDFRNLFEPPTETAPTNYVYGVYIHLKMKDSQDVRKSIRVSAVTRYPATNEVPVSLRSAMCRILNPQTNLELRIPFRVDKVGSAEIDLYGVETRIDKAQFYDVTIEVDGCKKETLKITL